MIKGLAQGQKSGLKAMHEFKLRIMPHEQCFSLQKKKQLRNLAFELEIIIYLLIMRSIYHSVTIGTITENSK